MATAGRVGLLWQGEDATAGFQGDRLAATAAALGDVGIEPVPVVYADEFAGAVRDRLLQLDGVLVWVNPIEGGRDRGTLDALLREVAAAGIFVSAHPDTILRMGTKQVLWETRDIGWGCDTRLYADPAALRAGLPEALAEGRPRVLKQYRGNGGNGVWKVEVTDRTNWVRVRHAVRGSVEEEIPMAEFLARCDGYFGKDGRIIDQQYQERLAEGMVRCYLVRDRVAGFGEQLVNLLHPSAPVPGPRLYYPPTRPDFQPLRRLLENDWVPEMLQVLGLDAADLPVIWDADFLYGAKTAAGLDTWVLCEINVSSVYPFPGDALAPLAQETLARLS